MATTAQFRFKVNPNSNSENLLGPVEIGQLLQDRLGRHPTGDKPRIKLKAIRRKAAGSVRMTQTLKLPRAMSEPVGRISRPRVAGHELLGELYTLLSLVGIVGVVIYQIVG